ncbi:hypothetical protein ANN_09878 [Periplaneta americana]|uniref:Uncharacterized protein n=1 Tax=Periplaneta americana TaxID=6978 RepID=A0ABQ8TMX5_PERAM|nr:hypothetical protein ANN_09878 [Periplaneta americana]
MAGLCEGGNESAGSLKAIYLLTNRQKYLRICRPTGKPTYRSGDLPTEVGVPTDRSICQQVYLPICRTTDLLTDRQKYLRICRSGKSTYLPRRFTDRNAPICKFIG